MEPSTQRPTGPPHAPGFARPASPRSASRAAHPHPPTYSHDGFSTPKPPTPATPCRRRSLTPTNRCAAPPSRGTRRRAHPPGVLDAAPSSRRDSLLPAPHPLFPPDGASSSCAARRCSCSSRPPPASVANPGTNSSSPPSSNSSLQCPFPFFQIPCSSRSANPDLGFWRGRRRALMEANFMHLQAMDR